MSSTESEAAVRLVARERSPTFSPPSTSSLRSSVNSLSPSQNGPNFSPASPSFSPAPPPFSPPPPPFSPSAPSFSPAPPPQSTNAVNYQAPVSQLCLEDLLVAWDPVKPTTTASESVFVFGTLQPSVLVDAPSRSVVVKLALWGADDAKRLARRDPRDTREIWSSLTTERKLYMEIHRRVIANTPHVLEGLYEGYCTDAGIFALRSSSNEAAQSLYSAWRAFRSTKIWESIPPDRQYEIEQEHARGRTPEEIVQMFPEMELAPTPIGFLVTPRVMDMTLQDYLLDPVHELSQACISEREILSIVVQVAQALSVLEDEQIMHHDLHTGNVFLRRLSHQRIFEYKSPVRAGRPVSKLTSNFFATLYDFDHGSGTGFINTTLDTSLFCEQLGECNVFVPNFDWYTFLSALMLNLTEAKLPIPPQIRTLLQGDQPDDNAFFGRPCACLSRNVENRCLECTLKVEFLRNMMSPKAFFLLHSK